MRIKRKIRFWKEAFELNEWNIAVTKIDPESVTYPDDIDECDRYYVGIEPHHIDKIATIYHDRDLTERDIIHELLHVRFPDWTEDEVSEMEGRLYNEIIRR